MGAMEVTCKVSKEIDLVIKDRSNTNLIGVVKNAVADWKVPKFRDAIEKSLAVDFEYCFVDNEGDRIMRKQEEKFEVSDLITNGYVLVQVLSSK
jgi:hypothetical protein